MDIKEQIIKGLKMEGYRTASFQSKDGTTIIYCSENGANPSPIKYTSWVEFSDNYTTRKIKGKTTKAKDKLEARLNHVIEKLRSKGRV